MVGLLSTKDALSYQQVQVMRTTSPDPVIDPSDEAELKRLEQMREDDFTFDHADDTVSEFEEAARELGFIE